MVFNDIEIKKFQIHDIDRLLVECASIDPKFEKFSNIGVGKLTDYATEVRYQNDYDLYDVNMPSAEETKNAIYLSRTIVNFVQEKIKFKLNL